MRKLLLTTTTLALTQFMVSAAGAQDSTVTYRSWSPVIQTLEKMVASTEEAVPGIKIDVKTFNYGEYLVDLQTRANAGGMPDLVGLEPGALTQQYRANLAPAQECAVATWGDDWQSKFFPPAVEQVRLGNPDVA